MATEPIKAGSDNPFAQTVSQAKSMAEDFTRLFSEKRGSAAGIRPTKCTITARQGSWPPAQN